MEIKLTGEIESYLDRCRRHIQEDKKNNFLGMHVTKTTEHQVQKQMQEADFAEFAGSEDTWPSLFLSTDEWKNSPYHSHVSLDLVKNAHFSYETQRTAGRELFNTDAIQKDPHRELNDWMKLRAMDSNFDAIYLFQDEKDWMMDAPSEAATNDVPAAKAHGNILTFGLGIGYFLYMALQNPNVTSITCIENSPQVIEMFQRFLYPQFPHNKVVNIIEGDAYALFNKDYFSQFDYVFTDIWQSSQDGLVCIEKLLMQYLPPFEKADFWIEDSCLEILWTLTFFYFDAKAHHHACKVNPAYVSLLRKVSCYYDSIDLIIDTVEPLKFYIYDTKTIRKILSQPK